MCIFSSESERGVSTTASTPVSRHCLTANGQQFKEGESWHDGCRDCYCHAGREMCVLISCPAPSCTNPVLRSHQCCPSCEGTYKPVQKVGTFTLEWFISVMLDLVEFGAEHTPISCQFLKFDGLPESKRKSYLLALQVIASISSFLSLT